MAHWSFADPDSADGCVGGPRPGAEALQGACLALWGPAGAATAGIYNCRKIGSGDTWSVHAEGRALDLSVPLPPSALGRGVLTAIASCGLELGVQRVIYGELIHDAATPDGRAYSGDDPHWSHLHIELTRRAGEGLTQSRAFALLDGTAEDRGEEPFMLIVAWRGAQWVVRGDLTSKVGIAQSTDVQALLRSGSGRLYYPADLSDDLMARIPQNVTG